jgi:hypothetical protein
MLLTHVLVFLLAEEEVEQLHTKVDLVITLGGDGTVLWVIFLTLTISFYGCQIINFRFLKADVTLFLLVMWPLPFYLVYGFGWFMMFMLEGLSVWIFQQEF